MSNCITGVNVMDENTMIRIYIDDESTASLQFMLLLAHGVGFDEKSESAYIPWGTRRIAHAADGGIYNTYRIPFSKSFRVTAEHPSGGAFWYIIRGVHNYPLIVGDLVLPKTSRLYVYKNVGKELTPLEFITLANVTGSAGALFQVTIAAASTDYNYLEACVRAKIDDDENTSWLSSGTEDFFLSAYYFNKGAYHFDNAGLTFIDGKGRMSAYKFFDNDPLLFTKSLVLTWRCGETANGAEGCPNDYPPPKEPDTFDTPTLANTTVTTYTWIYQYTLK